MAKKETTIERTYNVPLRKEFMKVPRWRKTQKATKALKEFLAKHMKSDDVRLSKEINEELWKHGAKNPPHHVKVNVSKDKDGVVKAELFGVKKEKKTEKEKKSAKKETKKEEPKEKKETKEPKVEEKKESAKEEKEAPKKE